MQIHYVSKYEKNDELKHFGVMGMHWGIRRYQPYAKNYKGPGEFIGKSDRKIIKSMNKASQQEAIKSKIYRVKQYRADQKKEKFNKKVDKIAAKSIDSRYNKETRTRDHAINVDKVAKGETKRNKLQDKMNKTVKGLHRQADTINADRQYIKDALSELEKRGTKFSVEVAKVYYRPAFFDTIRPIAGNLFGTVPTLSKKKSNVRKEGNPLSDFTKSSGVYTDTYFKVKKK